MSGDFAKAIVTDVSPLRVRLLQDVDELETVALSTIDADWILTGDRVLCMVDGTDVVIIGSLDSPSAPEHGGDSSSTDHFSVRLSALESTTVDLERTISGVGLILRSPDNTRWRLGVSNAGATTWTVVP